MIDYSTKQTLSSASNKFTVPLTFSLYIVFFFQNTYKTWNSFISYRIFNTKEKHFVNIVWCKNMKRIDEAKYTKLQKCCPLNLWDLSLFEDNIFATWCNIIFEALDNKVKRYTVNCHIIIGTLTHFFRNHWTAQHINDIWLIRETFQTILFILYNHFENFHRNCYCDCVAKIGFEVESVCSVFQLLFGTLHSMYIDIEQRREVGYLY
jgi:hypothetical protein